MLHVVLHQVLELGGIIPEIRIFCADLGDVVNGIVVVSVDRFRAIDMHTEFQRLKGLVVVAPELLELREGAGEPGVQLVVLQKLPQTDRVRFKYLVLGIIA